MTAAEAAKEAARLLKAAEFELAADNPEKVSGLVNIADSWIVLTRVCVDAPMGVLE